MRLLSLSLVVFSALAAAAPAQFNRPATSEHGYFPLVDSRYLFAPISDSVAFAVHNLTLYGIGRERSGPVLHRLSLAGDFSGTEVESLSTAGLPVTFEPFVLEANSFGEALLVFGRIGNQAVAYRARVETGGTLSEWQPLPAFPQATGTPASILNAGAWSFFFLTAEDGAISGWAGNIAAITDQFTWIEVPSPPENRVGAALLLSADRVLLTGGRDGEDGPPMRQTLGLGYELPGFFNWEEMSLSLPRPLPAVEGISHGGYHLLVPKLPLPAREGDSTTSQTVFSTFQRPSGTMSQWRENQLSDAPAPVREMLVDPGHRWLVLLSEIEDSPALRLSTYALPAAFLARHRSEEELLLDRMAEVAPEPVRRSVQETLQEAELNDQMALVVVTGGDRREDVELRLQMRSSRYRYMTQNTAQTYLSGEEGRRVLDQYGITETPAMLLMNSRGELVRRHSGTVPNAAELFELTSPTRITQAIPPPEE